MRVFPPVNQPEGLAGSKTALTARAEKTLARTDRASPAPPDAGGLVWFSTMSCSGKQWPSSVSAVCLCHSVIGSSCKGRCCPSFKPASSSFRYEHKCIIKMTETPKVDLKYHVKTRHEQGWARPGDSGTKGKGTCELPAGASLFSFLLIWRRLELT